MNDEIREAFLDLCHEMMLAHQRENSNLTDPMLSHDDRNLIFFVSQRYNYFGCVLDEIGSAINGNYFVFRGLKCFSYV